MELLCNIDTLKKLELSPNSYFFLLHLYLEEEYPWIPNETELLDLQSKGWIKITPEGVNLRSLFITKFKSYLENFKTDSWIEEWRDLWPSGVKTMGRPVRGDKQGCAKKMKAFLKENPSYTKEEIFDATKVYIFNRQLDNYNAMTCADYFIYKEGKKGDRISLLAANLEDLKGRSDTLKQMQQGSSNFQKNI